MGMVCFRRDSTNQACGPHISATEVVHASFENRRMMVSPSRSSRRVLVSARHGIWRASPSAPQPWPPSPCPVCSANHMVVQRNMEVPIVGARGHRQPKHHREARHASRPRPPPDPTEKWTVRVPAQDAGGPFSMTVPARRPSLWQMSYVGEVWIGSGQSNIDYRVHCTFAGCGLNNEAAEIAAANYPLIRSWTAPWNPSAKPLDASTLKASWVVTSPQTVGNVSAAGYFFARETDQGSAQRGHRPHRQFFRR